MKIAFTSCMRYEDFNKQPEWKDIEAANPDYLFLLGDQIYMDWGVLIGQANSPNLTIFKNLMNIKYEQQWKEENFKRLVDKMKSKNGFYGIWDDHDFLWNNAKGGDLTKQKDLDKMSYSRQMFHQYFNNCSTNGENLYYHIDTPFARVIFLDNRSYAEKPGVWQKMLGDDQFDFLEKKLNHDLPFTLVCGGLTLTEGGFHGAGEENWTLYREDFKYLCKLLNAKKNVLFLAGDIHENEFVRPIPLRELFPPIDGVPQLEPDEQNLITPPQIISSGMHIQMGGTKHNWALLEFTATDVIVKYFKKDKDRKTKQDLDLSDLSTGWLFANKGTY